MNNEANRLFIVILAAAVIVLMAAVIFLTWSADKEVIDRIGDLSEYLDEHNDSAGRLIVTLAALVVVVLSLLLIIVELAPEDEERELRVKQAGAVTIVPAKALRQRLEEALRARPDVSDARARVSTGDKGIATALTLTVAPRANVASVSQDAVRVAVDTIQNDLGLPVHGVPSVRVMFGEGAKVEAAPAFGAVTPSAPAAEGRRPQAPEGVPDMPPEPIAPEVSGPPVPPEPAPSFQPAPPPAPAREQPQPSPEAPEEPPPEAAEGAPAAEPGTPSPQTDVSRDPWRTP